MKKNQFKTLLEYVRINGGATLKSNGDHLALNAGYMVSLDGYEKQLKIDGLALNELNKYLLLVKKLKAYCGLWIDNGVLFLDISIRVNDLKLAKSLAIKNKQLAIYDLATATTIYIQ